jgi:hypothetical protein
MPTKIQIRRGTASQWTTANPTLSSGEFGLETDTDKVKLGDGETAWTSLAYFGNLEALDNVGDVVITSVATGQVLQYDGNDWVNADIDALPDQSGEAGNYLTTDGTTASWAALDIPPGTEVSDTAPADPTVGQLWWESDTGTLFIYYDGFWVEAVSGVVGPAGPAGPPLSANDVARMNGWLDGTIEPRPRGSVSSSGLTANNGDIYVTWFTPATDLTVSQVSIASGSVAASGVTLSRMGLYQTSDDGQSGTLLARTANDVTLFSSTNTLYTRNFDTEGGYPTTVTLTAGTRYGIAFITVATTVGSRSIYQGLPIVLAESPRAGSRSTSEADLPENASFAVRTTTQYWGRLG